MVIGSLILKLGVEGTNLDKLKQFESDVKKGSQVAGVSVLATQKLDKAKTGLGRTLAMVSRGLIDMRGKVLLVTSAMTALSIIGGKAAQSLHVFENNTGMSAQALQEWQQKAALVGISADEVAQSMQGLQQSVVDVLLGGGDVTPFSRLGVSLSRDANVMMKQLSAASNRMAPEVFANFAAKLGLSPSMISFFKDMNELKGGDKELILSKAELSRLRDFNIYFNRVWDNIKRSGNKIGSILSPIAKEVMWAFDKMAKFGLAIAQAIEEWGPAIKKSIVPLGIAIAALAVIFAPLTATLFLLALAFEDVWGFMHGEVSLTGGILGYFSNLNRVLQDTKMFAAAVLDVIESLIGLNLLRWLAAKAEEKITGKPATPAPSLGDQLGNLAAEHPYAGGGREGYDDAKIMMRNMKTGAYELRERGDTTVTNNINITGDITERMAKKISDATAKATKAAIIPRAAKEGTNK